MIHVLHNKELLEARDYTDWKGDSTVVHDYSFLDKSYTITSITVDTRKGYCELTVKEKSHTKLNRIT